MKDCFGWGQLIVFILTAAWMAILFLLLQQYTVLRTVLMAVTALLPIVLLDKPKNAKNR